MTPEPTLGVLEVLGDLPGWTLRWLDHVVGFEAAPGERVTFECLIVRWSEGVGVWPPKADGGDLLLVIAARSSDVPDFEMVLGRDQRGHWRTDIAPG